MKMKRERASDAFIIRGFGPWCLANWLIGFYLPTQPKPTNSSYAWAKYCTVPVRRGRTRAVLTFCLEIHPDPRSRTRQHARIFSSSSPSFAGEALFPLVAWQELPGATGIGRTVDLELQPYCTVQRCMCDDGARSGFFWICTRFRGALSSSDPSSHGHTNWPPTQYHLSSTH